MNKINLETGKFAGFEMSIKIRPFIADTEKTERDKKITADMNTNYLIERIQGLFVRHGFDTEQLKKGGLVDIKDIGKASYKLIPIETEK